jgi:predicted ATPase/DNA-binding CsgD family transcriptional regulator
MTAPLTTLIGRNESVAEAIALLRGDDVRLLTITGPGGIGKTRLVQAVASAVADRFADGVVFVPLQSVRDPGHVIGTIARSLGLYDGEGDLEQRLVAHVEGRQLLLVVDNFEQVVEAAPALAAIVAASPSLKVAVTSRTRLRIAGEQEFPVAPLARDAAVNVFLERAREIRPDFLPDEADLAAIAEICDQLDCLPLAIELAAARVKLLSPKTMVGRLGRRLELLTSGSRDAPARHRALRNTIDWSVDLLDDAEKTLFFHLSVFVGGCALDAVEEVCGGGLDALGSLVDKSLVRVTGERFGMLETIREYASELLDASPEAEDVRRRHAGHYLRLAQAGAAPGLGASDQAMWRAALENDHDNIRAALRFSLDTGDAATAHQLCASLWRFWFERGYLSEGRLWLDEALAVSSDASLARARALSGNSVLAHYQGDYDRAEQLSQDALELSRSLGDAKAIAEAYTGLALVRRTRGDYTEAERLFREALAAYEGLGDEGGIARTVDRLAMSFVITGEHDRGRPLFERSLELFRQLGDSHGIALALYGLAVTRPAGGHVAARAQVDESLDILRAVGDRRTFGKVLWCSAGINADLGDVEMAAAQFEESLTLFVEFGDRWFSALVLESAAFLAAEVREPERAVSLLGAAGAIWETLDVPLMGHLRDRHHRVLTEARSRLGEDSFSTIWERGRRLPVTATVELVASVGARTDADVAAGLTPREIDVLALVATGRTDAEVAEQLVVSLRTVHAHLRSVYRKLDLHTRSAATRYALEHGLAA